MRIFTEIIKTIYDQADNTTAYFSARIELFPVNDTFSAAGRKNIA
jgi:hypothetical protein